MMAWNLLDGVAERVVAQGGTTEIGALASEFLRVPDSSLARRTLSTLLMSDPRFRCTGSLVHFEEWDHGLHGVRLDEVTFAVLDFETNGLGPGDRAIEVGVSC